MRVIAGEFRSRPLKSLPGMETRPTPDRLREALFNILAPEIEGAVFVDAYAGTGAVGIEALSRGARRVIFLEKSKAACAVIRGNLRSLGAEARAEIRCAPAIRLLGSTAADIVFLDPPYALESEYDAALRALAGSQVPLVIAQHSPRQMLKEEYGPLRRARVRNQGDNELSFYRR
ncbi:MAG: 16S rRNA (guanine(966)-N(2))-methyltransferase RsmD [Bryobacteraceae bacterium]|nr:16S rRNA (guanine(966)-N(2))-methyltransferase RsmD [Bryobacteraceae bacterium]